MIVKLQSSRRFVSRCRWHRPLFVDIVTTVFVRPPASSAHVRTLHARLPTPATHILHFRSTKMSMYQTRLRFDLNLYFYFYCHSVFKDMINNFLKVQTGFFKSSTNLRNSFSAFLLAWLLSNPRQVMLLKSYSIHCIITYSCLMQGIFSAAGSLSVSVPKCLACHPSRLPAVWLCFKPPQSCGHIITVIIIITIIIITPPCSCSSSPSRWHPLQGVSHSPHHYKSINADVICEHPLEYTLYAEPKQPNRLEAFKKL